MSKLKKMDSAAKHDELRRLVIEERLINKALQAVRVARQKNNIEFMEIASKMKELQPATCSQNSASQKASPKKKTNTSVSCSSHVKNIDDPSIVNQTKLNLSVAQNMNVDEEKASEESE